MGDAYYFEAVDVMSGHELWKVSGVPGDFTVTQVTDLCAGACYGVYQTDLAIDQTLYFRVPPDGDTDAPVETWATDGNGPGSQVITEEGLPLLDAYPLVNVDGRLFTVANDDDEGRPSAGDEVELWGPGDDGDPSDLQMLTNIDTEPDWLVAFQGVLVFRAYTPSAGDELWLSDGTTAGTRLFKDINQGGASSGRGPIYDWGVYVVGDRLYFGADDGTHGYELWVMEGLDPSQVHLVRDINPGAASSITGDYLRAGLGSTFYFSANDGANGGQLWRTNGFARSTGMVKDLGAAFSSSSYGINFDGTLMFSADTGNGQEPHWYVPAVYSP
jgi:ELWxxDGT repeat protein